MNNVKKYVIIISMIFFVVIGIVLIRNSFLVGFVNEFRGKNMNPSFSTIDECIDYQMDYYRDLLENDNGETSYDSAELLYRLEYNNQLAIFFIPVMILFVYILLRFQILMIKLVIELLIQEQFLFY